MNRPEIRSPIFGEIQIHEVSPFLHPLRYRFDSVLRQIERHHFVQLVRRFGHGLEVVFRQIQLLQPTQFPDALRNLDEGRVGEVQLRELPELVEEFRGYRSCDGRLGYD